MDLRSKGHVLGQSFNKTPKATCHPEEVDILLQLQRLFGGKLSHSDGHLNQLGGAIFHWKLYGASARFSNDYL